MAGRTVHTLAPYLTNAFARCNPRTLLPRYTTSADVRSASVSVRSTARPSAINCARNTPGSAPALNGGVNKTPSRSIKIVVRLPSASSPFSFK